MIAITFALPAESSDFIRRLEEPRLISREGVGQIRGRLHGKLVAVIHTGVGKMVCRERMEVILRRERFDWLIEKATELGVDRLVPIVTERSARARASAAPSASAPTPSPPR